MNRRTSPIPLEVLIDGQQVGYIPRGQSQEMRELINSSGAAEAICDAKIVGGRDRGHGDTGFFGVRLNIVRPFRFETIVPQRSGLQQFGDAAFAIFMKVLWALVLTGIAFFATGCFEMSRC